MTTWRFLTLVAFCLFIGNDMYSSLFLHFRKSYVHTKHFGEKNKDRYSCSLTSSVGKKRTSISRTIKSCFEHELFSPKWYCYFCNALNV